MVEQGNSYSSVIMPTVKFYNKTYNSQFDHWIEMRIYPAFPNIFFYVRVKF